MLSLSSTETSSRYPEVLLESLASSRNRLDIWGC